MKRERKMPDNVTKVRDVYGKIHFVLTSSLNNPVRTQITLCTQQGKRHADWHAEMGWPIHYPCTIHRGNIRDIL